MLYQFWPDDDIRTEKRKIGKVPVLILRPAGIPQYPAAVLWIHGGGYFLGMKEMVYMGRGMDIVKRCGVTVVSPGYSLALRKPYPAAVDECFSVLQYMDEHKEEFGVTRIMAGGESAGGGLCAAVCMMARDRGIHISFQMPLYPMLSDIDTDSSRDNRGKVWNTKLNHLGWRVYLRRIAGKEVPPYASPARQRDLSGLPPCYTFVGDGEPFYRETLDYVQALKAAGIEAAADVYHTDVHAFDMVRPGDALSRTASEVFLKHFEYALEHYE